MPLQDELAHLPGLRAVEVQRRFPRFPHIPQLPFHLVVVSTGGAGADVFVFGKSLPAMLPVGCGDRRSDPIERQPCCAVVTFSFREREAGFIP